jgi:hypothetical protein
MGEQPASVNSAPPASTDRRDIRVVEKRPDVMQLDLMAM